MDYYVQVTLTSNNRGSALFDVLNEFYEDVAGASIVVQNDRTYELTYTLSTAADGTVLLADVPEGYYRYNISAPGHTPWSGMFRVEPGLTTTVPIALQVNLVSVEWSVTPVLLEDRYEITVSQTFETKVPAPVVVIDPPFTDLPVLAVGETYYGEFTMTNHGLIDAYDFAIELPTDMQDYEIVVYTEAIPERLGAQQSATVPYRITRLALSSDAIASRAYEDVSGYGGNVPSSWCSKVYYFKITWKCTVCAATSYAREVIMSQVIPVRIIYECLLGPDEALKQQAELFKLDYGSDALIELIPAVPSTERKAKLFAIPLCHDCDYLWDNFEKPGPIDPIPADPSQLDDNVRAGYYCLKSEIDSYNASRPKDTDMITYSLNSAYRTLSYNEHLYDTYWYQVALDDLVRAYMIAKDEITTRCPNFWYMADYERYTTHKGLGAVNKQSKHSKLPSQAFDTPVYGSFANASLESMVDKCELWRPYLLGKYKETWHFESIWSSDYWNNNRP